MFAFRIVSVPYCTSLTKIRYDRSSFENFALYWVWMAVKSYLKFMGTGLCIRLFVKPLFLECLLSLNLIGTSSADWQAFLAQTLLSPFWRFKISEGLEVEVGNGSVKKHRAWERTLVHWVLSSESSTAHGNTQSNTTASFNSLYF